MVNWMKLTAIGSAALTQGSEVSKTNAGSDVNGKMSLSKHAAPEVVQQRNLSSSAYTRFQIPAQTNIDNTMAHTTTIAHTSSNNNIMKTQSAASNNNNDDNDDTTTCLTETHCNTQRKKMGIPNTDYYVFRNNQDYGCFTKNGKAFWGIGGTSDDKVTALGEPKERVWCSVLLLDEGWENDKRWQSDPTSYPTWAPTKNPSHLPTFKPSTSLIHPRERFSGTNAIYDDDDQWKTDGYIAANSQGWNSAGICYSRRACNDQRKKMGVAHFYTGDYQTKGCFYDKGDNVFWGTGGSADEKREHYLPGVQGRVYCDLLDPTMSPTLPPTGSSTLSPIAKNEKDGWNGDDHDEQTSDPTMNPTKNPAWKDDGWDGDDHDKPDQVKDTWDGDDHDPTWTPTLNPTKNPAWNGDDHDPTGYPTWSLTHEESSLER